MTFGDERKLRLSYTNFSFNGSKILDQNVVYNGQTYNAEAELTYSAGANVNLKAGYRVFDLKANYNDDSAQIKFSGPFFSANWMF